MSVQEQLIEALRGLPTSDQEKVLAFVKRLQHGAVLPESLYDKARRLGAVGIVTDAPPDLSTNRRYLADLGRD
jgi:hypothetical protein